MIAGQVILLAVAVMVYFGFAHRVLDRLRLSDRAALLFLAAMIVGGFLPDIQLGNSLSINIGGGVIPLILVGYLWSKAEKHEIGRSVIAVVITAAVVYAAMKIMPIEPTQNFFLDPLYFIALLAGLVAYLAGRSRRSAFIAGTLAIFFNDLLARIENIMAGITTPIAIGGAGVFDAIVIAGFIALGFAELTGETLERISLGTQGKEGSDRENNPDPEGEPADTEIESDN